MLINIIRAGAAWAICSAFTDNNLLKSIFTLVIMFIVLWTEYDMRKRAQMEYDVALEEALTKKSESDAQPKQDVEMTDISDESICRYLDREWPAWIEVNGNKYTYDGPWHSNCDSSFITDSESVVLEPGVQYKLLPKEHKNDVT